MLYKHYTRKAHKAFLVENNKYKTHVKIVWCMLCKIYSKGEAQGRHMVLPIAHERNFSRLVSAFSFHSSSSGCLACFLEPESYLSCICRVVCIETVNPFFFIFIFFTVRFLTWCSMECKHIYEKAAVMEYIRSKNTNGRCPVAGILFSVLLSSYNFVPILIIFRHIFCQLVQRFCNQERWCVIHCYLSKSRKCVQWLSRLLQLKLSKISLGLMKKSKKSDCNYSRTCPDFKCICCCVEAICTCLLDCIRAPVCL